jgi:hypothetical protein
MIIIDDYLPETVFEEVIKDDHWGDDNLGVSVNTLLYETQPNSIFDNIMINVWGEYVRKSVPELVDVDNPPIVIESWKHELDPEKNIHFQEKYKNSPYKWHNDSMEWHTDYHLGLKDQKDKLFLPDFGFVFYCHEKPIDGGYLVIKRENEYMEWIEPKPNRMVMFESNLLHGVDKINKGTRRTFVSNIWVNQNTVSEILKIADAGEKL